MLFLYAQNDRPSKNLPVHFTQTRTVLIPMYSTLFPKPPTSYPQRTPAASARSWPSPYSFFTPVIFFSFFCPRTPILQIHVFYMQTYLLPIPSAHPGYNTVFNNAAFIFPQFVCQNQNLIRSVLCINVSSAKGTVDHFTQSVLILLKLPLPDNLSRPGPCIQSEIPCVSPAPRTG